MAEQHFEECCLHIENHAIILTEKFQNFREHKAFADVTLICNNGKRIKAHKIVLAACSPFFENTLKEENSSVIVLADITEQEIEAVLEFMYTGSLNIPRAFAPNLLRVAKRLQIRGLEGQYNFVVNEPTGSPPQKGTPSPPLSPVIKCDNSPKVINPFALRRRRNVADSDSTCSENELFSPVKTRKCEKQEGRFIPEPTSATKDDDSDVEFVEENPSVVVVNDTQQPDSPLSDSPQWFRKTEPKSKKHKKSKHYALNKQKDSSGAEISTVEKNVTDSETAELAPQTSTSENQSTPIKTTAQKEEKLNGSVPEGEFIKKGFGNLADYCIFCNASQRNIFQHIKCLHAPSFKRKKFTCQICSKKFFMECSLQIHRCNT